MTYDGHLAFASPEAPVRVAVVGAGAFGALHARAFAAHPSTRLVAVVDVNAERAQALCREVGAGRAVTGLEVLLSEDLVDAVSIAVGGDSRVELACESLSSGRSVLLEKPVALSLEDADRLRTAAEASDAWVMPAHILRFAEPYRQVCQRIRVGEIGDLRKLKFRRHRGTDHHQRFPDVHPVLMTMVHDLDLALWFSNQSIPDVFPVSVIATDQTREPGRPHPTLVRARVLTGSGATWEFETSWSLGPEDVVPDALHVVGTTGELTLDLGELRARGVAGIGPESAWLTPPDGGGALGAEVDEFVNCVLTGRRPSTVTLDDALRGLELGRQIIESLSGRNDGSRRSLDEQV